MESDRIMKLLIAADMHGSEYYVDKLIKAYRKEEADRMLLLGDLLYHGPRNELPKGYRPKGVIPLLNALKHEIICVRGNCDSEVDQMVLEFPIMADYSLIQFGSRTIFATHGHLYHPDDPPMLKSGDILVCGHTHVPKCEAHGEFVYINPGSVSIPKEGSEHGYIIADSDSGIFFWKTLEGRVYRVTDDPHLFGWNSNLYSSPR